MFTTDNTDGFTSTDLETMNEALTIRTGRGEDDQSASDAINNAWQAGANVEDLI